MADPKVSFIRRFCTEWRRGGPFIQAHKVKRAPPSPPLPFLPSPTLPSLPQWWRNKGVCAFCLFFLDVVDIWCMEVPRPEEDGPEGPPDTATKWNTSQGVPESPWSRPQVDQSKNFSLDWLINSLTPRILSWNIIIIKVLIIK